MEIEAQKMQLAEAFLRLGREALRGVPTDLGTAENFGRALTKRSSGSSGF